MMEHCNKILKSLIDSLFQMFYNLIKTNNNIILTTPNTDIGLFGIYGTHSAESCPLNNVDSAKNIIQTSLAINQIQEQKTKNRYKITNIIGQNHSALEHTFIWIIDAEDAHLIEQFCIDSKIATFNPIKIVLLLTFTDVVQSSKMKIS